MTRSAAAFAVFLLAVAVVVADPGDEAIRQRRYPTIHVGAKQLQDAQRILEKGDDNFKGHRVAAIGLVRDALKELDAAVEFASKQKKDIGEPTKSAFEPERGKLAVKQARFPAIREGAERIQNAGRALDVGHDVFGGHRLKAIQSLNQALDQLEKAVISAK